jgi:hypothetical protein
MIEVSIPGATSIALIMPCTLVGCRNTRLRGQLETLCAAYKYVQAAPKHRIGKGKADATNPFGRKSIGANPSDRALA